MKATWKGAVMAESDDTVVVEGNHYFPVDSISVRFKSRWNVTKHDCAELRFANEFQIVGAAYHGRSVVR